MKKNTEYIPKSWAMSQEGYDLMDDEARAVLEDIIVTKEEADDHTTIKHPEYGDILVTPGNYVLTTRTGNKTGMTPQDFELRYVPFEIKTK